MIDTKKGAGRNSRLHIFFMYMFRRDNMSMSGLSAVTTDSASTLQENMEQENAQESCADDSEIEYVISGIEFGTPDVAHHGEI